MPLPPSDIPTSTLEVLPEFQAQVFAYQGMIGGCGVTSLVVQTAYELSLLGNGLKQNTVCLVDLDFERGDCAAYLDKPPSLMLEDINATLGRMDTDLARTFVRPYSDTLSYVAPNGVLGGNDRINPDAVLGLLDSLCDLFDFIILDVPAFWRPVSEACIGAADKFFLVTELRVPALHRTRQHTELVTERLNLASPPEIIINKKERRSMLSGLDIKDAQQVLERIDIEQICNDEDALRLAVNNGQPVGKINPDARYVKSVRAHVFRLTGREIPVQAQPVSLFGRRQSRR